MKKKDKVAAWGLVLGVALLERGLWKFSEPLALMVGGLIVIFLSIGLITKV